MNKKDVNATKFFHILRYVGVQTLVPPTNYTFLQIALNAELNNTTVRSRRHPEVVFKAIEVEDTVPKFEMWFPKNEFSFSNIFIRHLITNSMEKS